MTGAFTMRHPVAALAWCLLFAGAAPAAYGQAASLAGTWRLNKEASDDPGQKMKEARESARLASTGKTRGNRRIRPEAAVSGAVKEGPPDGGAQGGGTMPAALGRIMKPAAEIVVEQNDTTVIISTERELPQIIYLDGRTGSEQVPGGGTIEVTAKWKNGKFTVERKLASGGSLKETYSVDGDRHRLMVEAKMSSPQLPESITIKRVYDAAP
jgi:hypothetical protein